MKKTLITGILLFIISINGFCQYKLEVDITGLRNSNGYIMFQLLDKNEKVIREMKEKIIENKALILFPELEAGQYAFRYFHDENLSEKLETGTLGIPKEGCGFSNNAVGPFGPKPFKEWLFELNKNTVMTVKTRYWQKN